MFLIFNRSVVAIFTLIALAGCNILGSGLSVDDDFSLDRKKNESLIDNELARATFNGWTAVRAVGKRSAILLAGQPEIAASVRISFAEMGVVSGLIESYNVYRDSSPDIAITETRSPYMRDISATELSFSDNAVESGTTYYYQVAPVVNGVVIIPESSADQEIKVIVPPPNMALVHRWMGNSEMCALMGEEIDRNSNYRCLDFDLGNPLLVDAYEMGCNYSIVGDGNPNGVQSATTGSVYYDQSSGVCYINNNNSTGWTNTTNATSAQLVIMASNKPGLPPLSNIGQAQSQLTCEAMSEPGLTVKKRLLHRKEWIVAASWNSSLADSAITTMEKGGSEGECNTNDGNVSPGTFDETLPGTAASGIKSVITGSQFTQNCLSRYGIFDMVGNVSEWTSDQINDGMGIGSNVDTDNGDFSGTSFDGVLLASVSGNFSSGGLIYFPWALSALLALSAGVIDWSGDVEKFHEDTFSILTTGLMGAHSGGYWASGTFAGRYALSLSDVPDTTRSDIGLRCAFVVTD